MAFSCGISYYTLDQCTQEVVTSQAQQFHSQVPRVISLEITKFGDRSLLWLMNLDPTQSVKTQQYSSQIISARL